MYIFVQSDIRGNHGYIVILKSKVKDEEKKTETETTNNKTKPKQNT
jgi:hypothetical protein